ncbi:hypothetical protein SUGI_1148820 [Cryptomeria japonica]|nr:hypothetical protein SUGI_1148820 [Cryptomeria japonica]
MGSSTRGGINVYTTRPPTTNGNSTNTTMSPCMFNRIKRIHWMSVVAVFLASVDTFAKVVEVVKIASWSEEEKKKGMSTTYYIGFQVPILEEGCMILASDGLCEDAIVLIGYVEEAVKMVTPILEGTYERIAPRSGLTWKHSIAVGAKVIDADCRGLIVVIPFNHADQDIQVYGGERITQLIIVKNNTGIKLLKPENRCRWRIKESIHHGGEKISPSEVDAVLLSHLAVAQAMAFGVPND